MPTRVWLSIGSNVERKANIVGCVRALRNAFGELILSRVYENASLIQVGGSIVTVSLGSASGPIENCSGHIGLDSMVICFSLQVC